MTILKEEINQIQSQLVSFAKWKIVLCTALIAVGMGLDPDRVDRQHGYLLLYIVPWVCLLADVHYYQRVSAIHALARFIRIYHGEDKEMEILRDYEITVREYRTGTMYFPWERIAQFGSSIGLGVGGFYLSLLKYPDIDHFHNSQILIPGTGMALAIMAMGIHLRVRKKLARYEGEQAGTGQPATRPESKSEGGDNPQPESEGRSR